MEPPVIRRRSFVPLAVISLLFAAACGGPGGAPDRDEILWDSWGVPHIYGTSDEAVFRGLGWAQMESHGDLILRLYGQARGRAAEYWGAEYLDSDRWVRTVGIPERGQAWLDAESPEMRRNLEAFAAGMNAYAAEHADRLDDEVEAVLPVTAADVLAHGNRVIHFTFVTNQAVVRQANRAIEGRVALGPQPMEETPEARASRIGSNAWAIGPSRSESGDPILVANPHLPWQDLFLFYEAHLVGPEVDVYGTTLVGVPGIAIGFNDHLGWTHTVNTYDGADLFTLALDGDGYRFGDEARAFDTHDETLLVRTEDGGTREETLTLRSSVHGPIVAQSGDRAVALRVAGLDRPGLTSEWWEMAKATDLGEFEAALSRLQIPMFNVIYADVDGHTLYVFNAEVPRRDDGDVETWRGAVDGGDPATLWTDYLGYEELPRVLDPAGGWLQNTNDPPWTSTVPQTLDADAFPAYLAPRFMSFRSQRSAHMLRDDASITFEEAIEYKHSTRMEAADRVLDELLAAARERGGADAKEAADVLDAWDRTADAGSRGGVLFERWLRRWTRTPGHWATPWSEDAPDTTPAGIADPGAAVALLEAAAEDVRTRYGALDVPWGDVHRARRNGKDVPVSGASGDPDGVFRVASYRELEDGMSVVVAGDSYYSVMEFAPEGVRARVLLAYGNATQPHSAHNGDQLELYARKEMRTPWRTRAEIEAHLESTTDLSEEGR
jgi:acyl-homoserine-lactone acylase